MQLKRVFASFGVAFALSATLVVAPPAGADVPVNEKDTPYGGLGGIAIDESAPAGTEIVESVQVRQEVHQLDILSNLAVTDIVTLDHDRAINTVVWDQEHDLLQFYVYRADDQLRVLIDEILPEGQRWEIIPTTRPIAELEQLIESVAASSNVLPEGMTFVSGAPSVDGSKITIGVERQRSAEPLTALPEEISGVPVTFVEEDPAILTARVRSVAPVISGGYMSNQTTRSCTTGFPVLRLADSQPNMLTADHCVDSYGEVWYWGNSATHRTGTTYTKAPGNTDLTVYIEPDSLSTWVFAGDHNDASSVLPIRGYMEPVGGNSICYSGSRSGLVCSNVLESIDWYNCAGSLSMCYWIRWSTHSSGTPAAGNGDSGGPAIHLVQRSSDNTIGAYGVGVISMIANGTPTCTGDPGSASPDGRKCSDNVGFARLSRWTSAQSTHGLAYTTS